MAKYTIDYSDSVDVDADSEDEAIAKACDRMFCDDPKDYCFSVTDVEEEEEDA